MQLYKPNSSNTGHAFSIEVRPADAAIYLSFIKQASWDAAKKIGSFSANRGDKTKCVSIKFTETEVAGIVNAIETLSEFSYYHTNAVGNTNGKIRPYYAKTDGVEDTNGAPKGFSLSAVKTDGGVKTNFIIGLTFGESVLVREFLKFALWQTFKASMTYKKNTQEAKPIEPETAQEAPTETSDW